MTGAQLNALIDAQQDYVVQLRRMFHEYPEIGHEEVGTKKRIMAELDKWGIPYETVEGNGLIVRIEGGLPGKAKLLRADMDALPVQEDPKNLKQPKVCLSRIPGKCHACGHDAHMAMLLTTLKVLNEVKDQLPGTVYGVFEEAEEYLEGSAQLFAGLAKYKIDECFALHVYYHLDVGKVNVEPGPRMAGSAGLGVTFHGKSGHGSRPDQAINPIIPLAHYITQLNSAYNNRLNVEHPVTLGIGQLVAGTANNIIPETASVYGSSRFFNVEEGRKAFELMTRLAENTAASFGCTVEYDPMHKIGVNPVINDKGVVLGLQAEMKELFGDGMLSDCEKWYASESFSRFTEKYPGAIGFLGIRNEALGSGALHHSAQFDIDERALLVGVRTEVAFGVR